MSVRLLVAVSALTFAAFGVVVATAAKSPCTISGTPVRDAIAGTPHRDVICARGEGDYVAGGSGNDELRGDGGGDTLVGGRGDDRLLGNAGGDRLFGVDGSGGDVLKGGSGNDLCFGDRGDKIRGCERTFRGASVREANSLAGSFLGALQLAEILATPVPPVGPPGQSGRTFPPCTQPPPVLPPPC